MRICACVGCHNSDYWINLWKESACSRHGCVVTAEGCDCPPPFRLFRFPKDEAAKETWAELINRKDEKTKKNWRPDRYSRVCSQHFVDGQPTEANPNPTLKLGYEPSTPKIKKVVRPPQKKRSLPVPPAAVPEAEVPREPDSTAATEPEMPPRRDHDAYTFQCDSCDGACTCRGCFRKDLQIRELKHQVRHLKRKLAEAEDPSPVKRTRSGSVCHKYLASDAKTQFYTGLPSRQAFEDLYTYLAPSAKKMRIWQGVKRVVSSPAKRIFKNPPQKSGPQRKLPEKDQFFMVLMKLRLGTHSKLLADIFDISASSVSRTFSTWVKMLESELSPLVFWPDKEEIHRSAPLSLGRILENILHQVMFDCEQRSDE